ncbi:T6SS effector amidase Tae4 family protein, partial [Salmonella enterica]
MNRPSFNEAWLAFRKVNHSVADVGSIIGGNVGKNITGSYFQNACPIRMSYVLNATGFPIARNSPYAKVSGADNKFYIYRVNDMIDYLTHTMGKPDLIVNNPKQSDF